MLLKVPWIHALLLVAGSLGVVAGLVLWGLNRFIDAPRSHGTWIRPWLIRLDYQLRFSATALGVGLLGGSCWRAPSGTGRDAPIAPRGGP